MVVIHATWDAFENQWAPRIEVRVYLGPLPVEFSYHRGEFETLWDAVFTSIATCLRNRRLKLREKLDAQAQLEVLR